jgi:hypothetical protein
MVDRPRTALVTPRMPFARQAPKFLELSTLTLLAALGWSACSAQKPQEMQGRPAQSDNAPNVLVEDQGKPLGSVSDNPAGSGGVITPGAPAAGAMSNEPPRLAEADSCVSSRIDAERVPVDMYIMLDRSGSMLAETGAGPTKWDATREALDNFIQDSRSEGLGVGLQYFPIGKPGVPDKCMSDAQCGADGGPCINRLCQPARIGPFGVNIAITYCLSDADCPLLSNGCQEAGQCASDPTLACFSLGADGCGTGDDCGPLAGECYAYASCEPDTYALPEVAIATLPTNAPALTASLAAASPLGLTPTYAALGGALEQARTHARANPTHRVVAVLATDGTPAGCELDTLANVQMLAAQGLASDPSINTYVVGVFSPEETDARTTLDGWAEAGGTNTAFVVDPLQDVSAQFLEALEKIRGVSLACEYQVPQSPNGSTLDYNAVNVALVIDSQSLDFRYVADPSRCDRAALGWYYDVEPTSGTPTKITVCDQACRMLAATTNGRVEVRLGCVTMGPD